MLLLGVMAQKQCKYIVPTHACLCGCTLPCPLLLETMSLLMIGIFSFQCFMVVYCLATEVGFQCGT